MRGSVSSASTASLSPCTTFSTPSGIPDFFSSSAISSEADGSRSEGFQTKVLPQASATGNIHMPTIIGKLNGVMPMRADAKRLAQGIGVDAGTGVLRKLALHQMRNAAGEFHHLDRPLHLAARVGQDLAVFGGNDLGQPIGILVQQLLEREQDAGTAHGGGGGPAGERGGGRGDSLLDLGLGGQRDLPGHFAGGRVIDVGPAAAALLVLAVDKMLDLRRCGRSGRRSFSVISIAVIPSSI